MGRPAGIEADLKAGTAQDHCVAVILAGGRSQRMGSDKALLGQPPLIAQVCSAALTCCRTAAVVTPWPNRYAAHLPVGVRLWAEPAARLGPLVAFAWALDQLEREGLTLPAWVLLLACDWAGLSGAALQQAKTQLATVSPAEIACLPRSPKGWEPLCGFYRGEAKNALVSAIAQGKRSFQSWLAIETVAELQLHNPGLVNCNTPADWQQAQHP